MDIHSDSYQDLFNEDVVDSDLTALQNEVDQIEQDVLNLETRVTTNETNISTNTTNIGNNTSNIAINTTNIATNTSSITTLNNTVLLRDGSIDLDAGYNPSNNQSIATKLYVDSNSTSGNYLRTDGTNSMTGNLNLNNNDLINIDALRFNTKYIIREDIPFSATALHIGDTNTHDEITVRAGIETEFKNDVKINGDLNLNNNTIIETSNIETVFKNTNNGASFYFRDNIAYELKIEPGVLSEFINDVKINSGDLNLNNNDINNCGNINFSNGFISHNNGILINENLTNIMNMNHIVVESFKDIIISKTNPNIQFNLDFIIESNSTETKLYNTTTNSIIIGSPLIDELTIKPGVETEFKNAIFMNSYMDMNSNQIHNVSSATANTDAVNLGQVNTIAGNYLPLAGGTMSGDINMGTSNIIVDIIEASLPNNQISLQAQDIYALGDLHCSNITPFNQSSVYILGDMTVTSDLFINNIKTYTGTNIDVDCNSFHISSGTSGDCKLILEADEDNNDENDTPQILFKADGGIIESAIYLNNNSLDIVSSVSSNGGIRFLTTLTSDYENGNLAMSISNVNQNVSISNDLDIGADLTVDGSTFLAYNNYLDLGHGLGGNRPSPSLIIEGKIIYSTSIASQYSLNIYGGVDAFNAGLGNKRLTQIHGNVNITERLTISDFLKVNQYQIIAGSEGDMAGTGHKGVRQLILNNTINASAGWAIGNQYDTPTTGDNDLYFEVRYTNATYNVAGFIQDSVNKGQMNFTGVHRCASDDLKLNNQLIGLIVESTGKYRNMIDYDDQQICNKNSITISESLPLVALCNEEKSKKVFGVLSDKEGDRRSFGNNFQSQYTLKEGDERYFINSIGEGAIWIHNNNGNIQNGDYICSYLNGYGQKQDEVQLCNFTVAKATMDCDFNPQMEQVMLYDGTDEEGKIKFKPALDDEGNPIYEPEYECITLDDGSKIAFIGVTYHCG